MVPILHANLNNCIPGCADVEVDRGARGESGLGHARINDFVTHIRIQRNMLRVEIAQFSPSLGGFQFQRPNGGLQIGPTLLKTLGIEPLLVKVRNNFEARSPLRKAACFCLSHAEFIQPSNQTFSRWSRVME